MKSFKKIIIPALSILILITSSCSDPDKEQADTILSGDWQLVSSESVPFSSEHDYFLSFRDNKIYSMHNRYGIKIVDCYQKSYIIKNGSIRFTHQSVDQSIKFSINIQRDTLKLYRNHKTYRFIHAADKCQYDQHIMNRNRYNLGQLKSKQIDEASGMIVSKNNPGVIWTHNDSGSEDRIFAIDYRGNTLLEVWLENVDLVDCEDISIMDINGEPYILLADIGDNKAVRDDICIYLIPEVAVDTTRKQQSISLTTITRIPVQLGSARRDAETLVTLPDNDIMIISKREKNVHVYRENLNNLVNGRLILDKITELPYYNIVAGDFHEPTGSLLIKDYGNVYTMLIDNGIPNIYTAKSHDYLPEPQGEALSWDLYGTGYFTLSEKRNLTSVSLYYYPYMPYWMR